MWSLIDCNDSDWSELIKPFVETTYFQDVSWAAHSRDLGWTVKRWQNLENDKPVGFLQGLLKIYFGKIGVLWFPDWIIGEGVDTYNLGKILKTTLKLRYLYIRFRSTICFDDEKGELLKKNGWRRPSELFSSGLSMHLDISLPLEEIQKKFGKKWRKSLRNADKSKIVIKEISNAEQIYSLYDEMKKIKSLKTSQIYSFTKIKSLLEHFDNDIVTLAAINNDRRVLAIRSAIIRNKEAFDIFAATGEEARSMNISHIIFLELIKKCKEYGCTAYDLGGIDPKANPGVYNFKKGTGAIMFKQLGEFEWTSHWFLSLAINLRSKYR